jgi:hypothetical protein
VVERTAGGNSRALGAIERQGHLHT